LRLQNIEYKFEERFKANNDNIKNIISSIIIIKSIKRRSKLVVSDLQSAKPSYMGQRSLPPIINDALKFVPRNPITRKIGQSEGHLTNAKS